MKFVLTAFLFCTFCSSTFAQTDKYQAAMQKNLSTMGEAFKDPQKLLELSNTFERIGTAEKTQWLPFYYAALLRINYGFKQEDVTGNDAIAEKSTALLDLAAAISPANSEISCLRSMAASLQLMVNPQERFMSYGATSAKFLAEAIQQNPNNPRPYFLKAQTAKYTPEQFGGGCKSATGFAKTAMEKFATFKPANSIEPTWGSEETLAIIEACK